MYTFPAVTPRIARLRKRYREVLPSFDSERVRIVTDYYRESENETPIIRRARALYRVLAGVPVRIEPDELLVGNSGKYYKGSMLFPEYGGIDWIPGSWRAGNSTPGRWPRPNPTWRRRTGTISAPSRPTGKKTASAR